MSQDAILEAVEQSRFKIEWAKNHINGVKELVESITSKQDHLIRPYQDPKSGVYHLYIGPQRIPPSLPLHIGDAIHNLNAVMDFLWSGLARAIDPELASKITFPRHEERDNLVKRLANPKGADATIKSAFPKVEYFILDDVQPYKRPNGLIWALNKLDNISKHRMLMPTTNIIGFKRDLVAKAEDGGTFVHKAGGHIKTNGPSLSVGFMTPFEVNNDAEPTIDVVFAEADPFTGEPILETLVNFAEAVAKVVKTFEETFV